MNWKAISLLSLMAAMTSFTALSYADTVWIDVRSALEHEIDNIEGDVRISHGKIVEKVNELYPDENTEIRLYCLVGGRAGKAMIALREAGYTNVTNAGGIEDARRARDLAD